jgi:hypothetical protein
MFDEEKCGDCQNFQQCECLFQCSEDATECDFSPSRFLRRGIGRERHYSRCGVFIGLPCDCCAIEDGKIQVSLVINPDGEEIVISAEETP